MAQRRMLNVDLILDDRFTQDLTPETQAMYVYLNMLADDDGIVGHLNRQLRMLNKSLSSIEQLVKNGYLLQYDQQTVIIVDWLVNNHIRGDRYTPSREDDCRSSLYITYDWRFSLDKNNGKVFTSYTDWLANKRKVNGQQIGQVSKEELKKIAKQIHIKQDGNQLVTDREPSGNQPVPPVSGSVPVSVSGSGSVPVSVSGSVPGTGIGLGIGIGKGKDINATTTSNGGMGEVSSSTAASTSTIDNNATKKSTHSEQDGVQSSVQDSNHEEANTLLDYINSRFTGEVHTENNERLTTLLADLQNEYQAQYIQQGIDELVDQVGNNYNVFQVPSLFINHLADAVKEVVSNQ